MIQDVRLMKLIDLDAAHYGDPLIPEGSED